KFIESISVKPAQIGADYKLADSFYVDKSTLHSFEVKFNSKLDALKNDVFVSPANRVQINYIEADSSANAEKVYKEMVGLVGKSNVVALKGNVIVEVITNNTDSKKRIVKLLSPNKVHTNY
ncbi:MAG: hypothetical protein AB7V50_08000, partial [Vampirovibrionia bacterium]